MFCSLMPNHIWFKWKLKIVEVMHKDKPITKKTSIKWIKLSMFKLYSVCSKSLDLTITPVIKPRTLASKLIGYLAINKCIFGPNFSIYYTFFLLFLVLMKYRFWFKFQLTIAEVIHKLKIQNQQNKYQMKKYIQYQTVFGM